MEFAEKTETLNGDVAEGEAGAVAFAATATEAVAAAETEEVEGMGKAGRRQDWLEKTAVEVGCWVLLAMTLNLNMPTRHLQNYIIIQVGE